MMANITHLYVKCKLVKIKNNRNSSAKSSLLKYGCLNLLKLLGMSEN